MQTVAKTRSKKFDETSEVPKNGKKDRYSLIGGSGKTSDKIALVMWNVNGIRSVLNKKTMRDLTSKYNPDFICVNETKINEQLYNKQKIKIDGYKDYWNFCKVSAGYSGVAVFTKFIPISTFEDLEEPQYSQEGRILTLEYELFYLVVIYMPSIGVKKPGDKDHDRLHFKTQKYQVSFQKHCENLKAKGKGVIICGDMNVCHQELDIHVTPYAHKQPGFTYQERTSFKHFLDKGWVDTYRRLNPMKREYTWWKVEYGNREKNIGKRLDYFLVNEWFMKTVTKALVLSQIKGSDHCPVYLAVNLNKLSLEEKLQIKQLKDQGQKEQIEQPEKEKENGNDKEEEKEKEEAAVQLQTKDEKEKDEKTVQLQTKDEKEKEEAAVQLENKDEKEKKEVTAQLQTKDEKEKTSE